MFQRNFLRSVLPVVAVSLLVAVGSASASAGSPITIEGGSHEAAPGSAFAFAVAGDSPGQTIGSFSISLEFDPSVVQPVSCQSSIAYCSKDSAPGLVVLNAVSLAGWSGDVDFGTVVFEVIGSNGSETPIDLDVTTITDTVGFDLSQDLVVTDGEAIVDADAADHLLGDANCDSELDASDGLAILKQIARVGQSPCAPLGDFNCDDRLNVTDALDILRSDGGLHVSTPECP